MSQQFHFWVICPKIIKILIQKDICTPMSTAVSFTTVKIRKQPECLSIDKSIKKM